MFRMLLAMIRKEFQQLLRDPVMLRVAIIAPALQLLFLGYAANLDVNLIPMVLVDLDRSAESRRLARDFTGSGYFELAGSEEAVGAVEPWLVSGRAQIGLVIDRGFGRDIAAGRRTAVQLIVDGSETTSATSGMAYAAQIVARRNGELLVARLAEFRRRAAASGRPFQLAGQAVAVPRVWYNPDLRSRWFYVPAVLAMVLMMITMILSAMGVVREKEIGTMEQLIVTPLKGWQIITGKLLPFGIIGVVDLFLVIALAVGWFRVPLRGSLLLLVGLTLLFVINTLSLGLLVSTLVRTQQQAMMAATFLVMLPMIYLSGLLFPIDSMPPFLQLVSRVIPVTYYAEILRGVFLKGAGIAALWPQAVALAGFGILFLALASARFSKRLD